MPRKKVPIGVSDFAKLITRDYLFVDKSLIIKEILERGAEVTLITRPRRWGKTLFMSMLQHFFAAEVNDLNTKGLFANLKIAEHEATMQHQGQYPVIFISLKDVKAKTFEGIFNKVYELIRTLYDYHNVENLKLSTVMKDRVQKILVKSCNVEELVDALKWLSEILFKAYSKKVIILVDEYDAPLNNASDKSRKDISDFLGKLLSGALKDNPHLQFGVLTGILRLAKANILSGLNNLKEYTLLDNIYKQYFGFTEAEVADLFRKQGLSGRLEDVKNWYNGYRVGDVVLYNPWSVLNCLEEEGKLQPYWIDTGDNKLIENTLTHSSIQIKQHLESLIQGKSIEVKIDKHITFEEISANAISVWSLLFNTGYLTVEKSVVNDENTTTCQVRIPNREVKGLYIRYIKERFIKKVLSDNYNQFITSLITGRVKEFKDNLKQFLVDSFSYFDTGGQNPERVYHTFVLGLIADLHKSYVIRSNRESGTGRYDVLLLPRDKKALGIILEFKSIERDSSDEVLMKKAQAALEQIKTRDYESELRQHGIENKLFVAIIFAGKRLELLSETQLTPEFDAEEQLQSFKESQSPFSSKPASPEKPEVAVSRLFGEIQDVSKQVEGQFQGETITFNVYRTQGDGNCGFYSLPIPYDRAGVIELLLKHSKDERIRKLVAPEIMEACKSRYLPKEMVSFFKEFNQFNTDQNQLDEEAAGLLRKVLDFIDPNRNIIPDREFNQVMAYLESNVTEEIQFLLQQMQEFKQRSEKIFDTFKSFCQQEEVFQAFCQHYVGGTGELSFSVGGLNFNRETSFLDAVLEVVEPPIHLYIWESEEEDPKKVKIVYEGGRGDDVTHIYHRRGQDTHFELMSCVDENLELSVQAGQESISVDSTADIANNCNLTLFSTSPPSLKRRKLYDAEEQADETAVRRNVPKK